jgi:hypothetical protein
MRNRAKEQVTGTGGLGRRSLRRRSFLGVVGAVAVGLLAGVLAGGVPNLMAHGSGVTGIEFGPRVDLAGLKENFAPQEVKSYTVPPGGIDNLGLHSTDIFEIPGHGEFQVDFRGYFRVARAHPTTYDWNTAGVRVNIIDLRLLGEHEKLGTIRVSLNPDIVSSGQIFPTTFKPENEKVEAGTEPPKDCRIATGAIFDIASMDLTVFNKEPILLMNKHVTKIPPVDDPSGHALLFKLPLYNVRDPHGEPVAYLTSLKYGADHYLTKAEVRAIRDRHEVAARPAAK